MSSCGRVLPEELDEAVLRALLYSQREEVTKRPMHMLPHREVGARLPVLLRQVVNIVELVPLAALAEHAQAEVGSWVGHRDDDTTGTVGATSALANPGLYE